MRKKEKIPVDMERISRIFDKLMKVLQKEAKSPIEAFTVLKFGVAFFEISMGVKSADDSNIRDFIKEMLTQEQKE